jgi:hypothetical protein
VDGQSGLVTTTKEGWLAGAQSFWLMPAGIALFVALVFAVTFRDRSAKAG